MWQPWAICRTRYTCLITPLSIPLGYAGVAVQVLQQLREFDAPAMQSCKPLPCGTGSCQNRRLREQTLTRKPCHCDSIKGGWCMELPTTLDQPLQKQIVCACFDMFLPVWHLYLFPERVSLVTCKSRRHFNTFCLQLPWNVQLLAYLLKLRAYT